LLSILTRLKCDKQQSSIFRSIMVILVTRTMFKNLRRWDSRKRSNLLEWKYWWCRMSKWWRIRNWGTL